MFPKDCTIEGFDPELAKAIQETVWAVVSNHPLSGVKAKPGAK